MTPVPYIVKATEYGTLGAKYVASHVGAIVGILGGIAALFSGAKSEGITAIVGGLYVLATNVDPSKV